MEHPQGAPRDELKHGRGCVSGTLKSTQIRGVPKSEISGSQKTQDIIRVKN